MRSHYLFTGLAFMTLMSMVGCSGFNPVTDTAAHFIDRNNRSAETKYLPGFEYLEVDWQGRKAAMALGYRLTTGGQLVEHWYSGQGEMIKLVNGRITKVMGMTSEVRNQSTKIPSWSDLLSNNSPLVWQQNKDVMPGYRYGLKEFVRSRAAQPNLVGLPVVNGVTNWVIEEVTSKDDRGRAWIYEQKFALQNGVLIYSEQCVAHDLCFKLKPLGVVVAQ